MKRQVLPTRELASLIEASERTLLLGFYHAAKRLRPDAGFERIEIAGGIATFFGTASPLSQATGLGLSAPVSTSDIERLTRFYHERGAPARVSVNPLASLSLERELANAGYSPIVYNNVLAMDTVKTTAQRDARISEETDAAAWGRASARGFSNRYANEEDGSFLAMTIALGTGVTALSARESGQIVATGAMCVHDSLASLFAGSTLDEHRRNGYHRAMIVDRIARAREAGARYARTAAPVASTSEANFRSCGFEVLYTRSAWELPASSSVPA